jgi:glycosyltransferase involved in cell wall biosynthesis
MTNIKPKKPVRKICIVGLDDYRHLANPDAAHSVGGESVQHVLLARAWRDQGLEVSMIVHDHGQGRVTHVDGIRAVAVYRRSEGIPMLRFAHPRITRMIAAMREIDADVYYQSPSGSDTGITAWFCRRAGKRSVIRIASDLACIPGRQLIRHWRDRRIYEYGLRNADLLVAQSNQQRELLMQHYGLQSEIVNMAVGAPTEAPAPRDIDVLWTANLRPVKRAEVVLELAQRLPAVKFTIAGGRLDNAQEYFTRIQAQAQRLPNITFLGAVPFDKVGALFNRSHLFLNTSSMEGFPNTFLQAWVRGVPVITFFDPDRLVQQKQLGYAAISVDDMATAIESLLRDEIRRRSLGEHARAFASEQFLVSRVAQRYLDLLEGESDSSELRYGTAG